MTLYQLFLDDSIEYIKDEYIPDNFWFDGLSNGFGKDGDGDCFYFATDEVETLSEDSDPFDEYPFYHVRWENGVPVACKEYEGVFVYDKHLDLGLDELKFKLLEKLGIGSSDLDYYNSNLDDILDEFVNNVSYNKLFELYLAIYLAKFEDSWEDYYENDYYKTKDLNAQGLVDRAYELVSKNKSFQKGLKVFEKNYAKHSSYFTESIKSYPGIKISESPNLNEMIVDAILDRQDGDFYTEKELKYMYDEATIFGLTELARAIDIGTDKDIKRELCNYIDSAKYNPEIKDYINSVDWLKFDDGTSLE